MKLKPDDLAFLDGLLSGLDDLPDGAWGAMCKDLIESTGKWPNKDPHDVWLAWLEQREALK